jgi:hypothetical protein
MSERRTRRGNGSSSSRSSSSGSDGSDNLQRIITELRATAVRARDLPQDPTVVPFSSGQFQTLTNHLQTHLVHFDPFQRVETYLSRCDIFQTDVYNAVHTLINGLHEQRGMTLETLDYLVEIIDFWSNRPSGEFAWEFSRRLCLFLMRLDPSHLNPVSFRFSLSIPLASMFTEFLRADYPDPAPLAPAPLPRYSGDRRVMITEVPFSDEDLTSSIESIAPTYPPEDAIRVLLPDIPQRQLTTAIANAYSGRTGTREIPCVICTDDIGLRRNMSQLPCGHIFHTACIAHVFYYRDYEGQSRPCPCCRYDCGPVTDAQTIEPARKRARELELEYFGEEFPRPRKRARRSG